MTNNNNLQFIQSASKGGKYIINGATGSCKTELLLARYKYMIQELGIPSDSILVLLSNGFRLQQWKKCAAFNLTSGLKCYTFNGFIQDEINTYYPLVSSACAEIEQKAIKPVFLGYEPSKYLVSKAIQLRRERNSAFSGLVSTPERAASEMIRNLLMSSTHGIPSDEIGARLQNALERKDELKITLLKEADNIMESYRSKSLELGVFDLSMYTWLYDKYLHGNLTYIEMLNKRIRHILIDDLQDCTPVQIGLFRSFIKAAATCTFSLNKELLSESHNSHITSFVGELELNNFEVINLHTCYTCSSDIHKLSDRLVEALSIERNSAFENNANECAVTEINDSSNKGSSIIERHPSVELRSDMLQQLGERVVSLIDVEGYKPSEIVILSTYADTVTELVLSGILKQKSHKLCNISKRSRISDSPLCRSILTFAQLCHPDCRLFPLRDDLKLMCSILFTLDPVRSTILARRIYNAIPFPKLPDDSWLELEEALGNENYEKYLYIKRWSEAYLQQEAPLSIGEFLYKALIEIFLSAETDSEEALKARKMIDIALQFTQAVSSFKRNTTKDFIDMARNQSTMPENREEQEESLSGEQVILTTPAAFLSNALSCKVAVICGLSSDNWMPRAARELSNPYVLHSSWKQDMVYTSELDDSNRKVKLAQLLGAVFKKCSEKLVTFESNLSSCGFQNDGLLSEIFSQLQ